MFDSFKPSNKGEYNWNFKNKKVYLKITCGTRITNYFFLNSINIKGNKKNLEDASIHLDLDIPKYIETNSNITPIKLYFSLADKLAKIIHDILKKNTQILQEQNTNIYVNFPINSGANGEFYNQKSNSGNLFIGISLTIDILQAYFENKYVNNNSIDYSCVMHELTHGFDKILGKIKMVMGGIEKYEVISTANLLGIPTYSPSNISLCILLIFSRVEGITSLAEQTLTQKQNYGLIISFRKLFELFSQEPLMENLKTFRSMIEMIGMCGSAEELPEIEKELKGRPIYTVGRYMCLIIVFAKLIKSNKIFFCFGKSHEIKAEKTLHEIFLEFRFDEQNIPLNYDTFRSTGYMRIDNKYIIQLLQKISNGIRTYKNLDQIFSSFTQDVNIFFPKETVEYYEYIINFISRLKVNDFYVVFVNSCSELEIDPLGLDYLKIKSIISKTTKIN